jgi:molybdopterin adenylyltransferase
MMATMTDLVPANIAVLSISDTRTLADDRSGQLIVDLLGAAGHHIAARLIVKDHRELIRSQLSTWIEDPAIDVVITTGGTGLTPRDVTPEALAPLVTKEIPGFGELFRWLSFSDIGTSTIQSRAQAALCKDTFVFLLPGSTGGVRLAVEKILIQQLDSRHRPCNFMMLMPRIRGERED